MIIRLLVIYKFFFPLLIFLEIFNVSGQADTALRNTYYIQGKAFDDEHNYDRAIEMYSKFLALDSFHTTAYQRLGIDYNIIGDYKSSLKCFEKAILIYKSKSNFNSANNCLYGQCFYYLAKNKLSIGNAKEALNDITAAIKYCNTNHWFYRLRAKTEFELENYRGTVDDYNRAQSISVKDSQFYIFRGISYFFLGQYDSAIIDLKVADYIGKGKDERCPICYIANSYFSSHDSANSNKYHEIGYNRHGPDSIAILVSWGNTEYQFGHWQNAYNKFKKLANSTISAFAYRNMALCAYELHDTADAIEKIGEAILLDSNYVGDRMLRFHMAGQGFDDRYSDIALNDLNYMLGSDSCRFLRPNLYAMRCNFNLRHGDTAGAIRDITMSIDLSPKSPGYYSMRALCEQKNFKQALKDADVAIKLDKRAKQSYLVKTLIYLNSHDSTNAYKWAMKANEHGANLDKEVLDCIKSPSKRVGASKFTIFFDFLYDTKYLKRNK